MTDQFSTDETLNSVLTRLRGRYAVLVHEEKKTVHPDEQKIEGYTKRGKEVNTVIRTIFTQTRIFKEDAIKKYSTELRNLDEASSERESTKLSVA